MIARAARLPKAMRRRPAAKGVLMALADDCDAYGAGAFPSYATIGGEAEVSIRTVPGLLEQLNAAGLIEEQAKPSQHRPRTWRVILPALIAHIDDKSIAKLIQQQWLSLSDMQPVADLDTNPDMQPVADLEISSTRPDLQPECSGRQIESQPGKSVSQVGNMLPTNSPSLNGSLNGTENGVTEQISDLNPTDLLKLTKKRLGLVSAEREWPR
jgi:hypothetical protein